VTIYPIEYARPRNINTPRYWDHAAIRMRKVTSGSVHVVRRVKAILDRLPAAPVQEYGFGHTHLGGRLELGRWHGFDFSPQTVKDAEDLGMKATMRRCGDAQDPGNAYVVALEVLEHLDHEEMIRFLDAVRLAHRAFFSVPLMSARDLRFPQHMRGFGGGPDLVAFLRQWWPKVKQEVVRPHWRLARCWRPA
jgi:hypothetical protein